ncbi:MAG: hypothetical protein QXD82_00605 [Nitrososphaerales archaeon]
MSTRKRIAVRALIDKKATTVPNILSYLTAKKAAINVKPIRTIS